MPCRLPGTGQTSVGTAITVEHTSASPIGAEITVTATIHSALGRKIEFIVTAHDGDREIGNGKHIRTIVDEERFMRRLSEKR